MIVVTGMHRGGTSLVANLLQELGVPFGDPAGFYPADEWNPRGYFEQRDVMDFNNRVVTGHPYSEGGWRRRLGQVRYVARPKPEALARRFAALLPEATALAERYGGVAVKDPRFCLTWKLWNAEGWVERVVVCKRHPSRSARSLKRRQRIPFSLGVSFWAYHMSALLNGLQAVPSLVIDTDRLARGEWEAELAAIDAFFGLGLTGAEHERVFAAVFDPALNRSGSSEAEALPESARDLWARLTALGARPPA